MADNWLQRARGTFTSPSAPPQAQRAAERAAPQPWKPPPGVKQTQMSASAPQPRYQYSTQQDAVRAGGLAQARPNAQGTPTLQEQKDAALSGNFSKVVGSSVDPSGGVGNGAWGSFVPMEKPPDSVLQGLNEIGFKVSAPKESPGMPASSFSSTQKLADHAYEVSNIEDEYLRNNFNQNTVIIGQNPGVIQEPVVPVDTALPLMHMEPTESAALTWESYDALSDQQKAAVDWNTLLIDAREKDLTAPLAPQSKSEREKYEAEVVRLFGDQGGSTRYAPNTMDLLSRLDVVQLGQDLDEYLSLERAIDDTQIADFKFTDRDLATLDALAGSEPEQQASYAETRTAGNISALNTGNVDAVASLISSQLANPNAISSDFETLLYGNADAKVAPLGFGDSTTDQMFQKSLAVLGMEDPTQYGVPVGADPMSFILADLEAMGADEKQKSQFLEYVGQQAQLYGQYGSEEQQLQAALVSKRAGLGG